MKIGLLVIFVSFMCFTNVMAQSDTLSDGRAKLSKKQMKEKWAVPPQSKEQLLTVEEQKALLATPEEMQWFEDAKFGVFIHWGPALAVTNTLSWGRFGERPAAGKQARNGVPPAIYDSAYKEFNPVNFDAERWVKQMKSWGAKYFTFTTKHHDGFCMFDAPNTDYDIMHTPFKRDIAKELADAAHKYGIKIFWYYSQPDWHHPDCLRKDSHYQKYLPYMKEQITYLLTHYGKIDGIFFDGLGSKYWNWDIKSLIPMMKKLQPGILINPRYGFGLPDMSIRGDYDTPEQGVGPIDAPRYWESCITVTDKWLYNAKAPIKSTNNMINLVVQSVGNGGNLLLNFGPNGKGEFVEAEAEQAEGLGKWLAKYGESIYGTRRGIYISGDWGTATQNGNKLYLHFLKRFANDAEAVLHLPSLPIKIESANALTNGFKKYKVTKGGVDFYFDSKQYNANVDNIVVLTLASSPEGLPRIATWDAQAMKPNTFKVISSSENPPKHTAASIFASKKNDVFSEGIHVKGWWQPKKEDVSYVGVEFLKPEKVKMLYLSEQIRAYTIQEFTIDIKDENGNWKTVYHGNDIGNGFRIKLSGNAINGVRMTVLKNQKGQKIKLSTFDIYN